MPTYSTRNERRQGNDNRSRYGRERYEYEEDNRRRATPERDEEGRFMSDDETGGRRNLRRGEADEDYRGEDRYRGSGRGQYRERDEEGRFMSDDDYGRREYPSRSARRDYEDDYRPSHSGRGSQYRERNEEGRFMSEDEDYGSRSGPRRAAHSSGRRKSDESRDKDYQDSGKIHRLHRGSSSAAHPGRGWHGDPQGHAKAGSHSHDNTASRRGSAAKGTRKSTRSSTKSSGRKKSS